MNRPAIHAPSHPLLQRRRRRLTARPIRHNIVNEHSIHLICWRYTRVRLPRCSPRLQSLSVCRGNVKQGRRKALSHSHPFTVLTLRGSQRPDILH